MLAVSAAVFFLLKGVSPHSDGSNPIPGAADASIPEMRFTDITT
jgi:hypothetical protein